MIDEMFLPKSNSIEVFGVSAVQYSAVIPPFLNRYLIQTQNA